jgi:hypothetical protein
VPLEARPINVTSVLNGKLVVMVKITPGPLRTFKRPVSTAATEPAWAKALKAGIIMLASKTAHNPIRNVLCFIPVITNIL